VTESAGSADGAIKVLEPNSGRVDWQFAVSTGATHVDVLAPNPCNSRHLAVAFSDGSRRRESPILAHFDTRSNRHSALLDLSIVQLGGLQIEPCHCGEQPWIATMMAELSRQIPAMAPQDHQWHACVHGSVGRFIHEACTTRGQCSFTLMRTYAPHDTVTTPIAHGYIQVCYRRQSLYSFPGYGPRENI
jgi:hypothetical protein